MPQLETSLFASQIFWLLLCLLALVSFMKNVFVPRMNDLLDARDKRIYGDLEKAKEAKDNTLSINKEYQKKIGENKVNARQVRKETLNSLAELKNEKLLQLGKSFSKKKMLIEKNNHIDFSYDKNFIKILTDKSNCD